MHSMIKKLFPFPQVSELEAWLLRVFFGYGLIHFMPGSMNQTTQPVPVGLAHILDLTWMTDPLQFNAFRSLFIFAVFAYVTGRWMCVTLPSLTLLHILPYTLMNSQGHPHHGYQVLSLSLLGLSVAAIVTEARGWGVRPKVGHLKSWILPLVGVVAAARLFQMWIQSSYAMSFGAWCFANLDNTNAFRLAIAVNLIVFFTLAVALRRFLHVGKAENLEPSLETRAWQLMAGQTAIAGAYLTSVITKMLKSDGAWLMNSHYVALDFVKTTRQSYYSKLDPAFQIDPPGVSFLLDNPWLARGFFGAGVVLETILILAVGTRSLAVFFGVSLFMMHRTILKLMTLTFYTNEMVAALFFINIPFLIVWAKDRFVPANPLSGR